MTRRYVLTDEDKKLIDDLLLDLATELDLHYDEEDFHALVPSFALIKNTVALLKRAEFEAHPDIHNVLARFNKARQ